MNPILARELRVRFRDKRSYWLLLGLTLVLCLLAGSVYQDALRSFDPANGYYAYGYRTSPYYSGYSGSSSLVIQQASDTGRKLFRFLAMGNVLAWLLIAPALTATGLAKERERGLLESLWLSAFRVLGQVLGRLGSTLCYLFVLQVAVLPIYGIALLLGGVSPAEIGIAGLVIGLAALLGASLGLWCSARAYRSSSALGAVFVLIGIWSFVAYQAMDVMWYSATFNPTAFALVFSHPVPLLYYLLSPEYFFRMASPAFSGRDALTYGLLVQLTATALLLWSTVRLASRPLPDRRWSEGNTYIKAWRARLEAQKKARLEKLEREKASQKMAGALLYELPVEKFVRFKNPLLAREVKGNFRLRQGGLGTSLLRLLILGIGVCFWLLVVFNAFDRASHSATGPLLMNGLLGFGILAVAVMASTSLVKERELGTWEGLRLSLLPPPILVRSKWLSPLITFVYWSAPLWILLPLCLRWNGRDGASPWWLALSVLVALASLSTVSAWGLWISRRAPHSAAATSWTLATLLFILMGVPVLDQMTSTTTRITNLVYYGSYRASDFWSEDPLRRQSIAILNAYHPFLTLNMLLEDPTDQYGRGTRSTPKLAVGLLHLIECSSLTALLLWSVTRRVKQPEK